MELLLEALWSSECNDHAASTPALAGQNSHQPFGWAFVEGVQIAT